MMKVTINMSFVFFVSVFAWGHSEKHHGNHKQSKIESTTLNLSQMKETYLKDIKPIFQNKCYDCHGSPASLPWYYKVPGARQLIDRDISESKEHLDMSNDYPFSGHGTAAEDLKAIDEVLTSGTMPPWRYRLLHNNSKVTPDEIAIVRKWIGNSLEILESNK